MKLRDILFESPDIIIQRNNINGWSSPDAIPFGYLNNEMILGKQGDFHGGDDINIQRIDFKSAGRLWVNSKIISFWNIDNKLKKIISDINNLKRRWHGKIIHIGNDWNVDVLSFSLIKYNPHNVNKWSMIKPLSEVLKEVDLKYETDSYSLIWNNYELYKFSTI